MKTMNKKHILIAAAVAGIAILAAGFWLEYTCAGPAERV